jgi:indole-3-glycerol phosphate synthase
MIISVEELNYNCELDQFDLTRMSKFIRPEFSLKTLTDNSYKSIDEGAYNAEKYNLQAHDSISLKKGIVTCTHAPLITEIKFASPSKGRIIDNAKTNIVDLASTIVASGSIGLSVVTQPYLFCGSIEYLAMIRKAVNVAVVMKDVIVSEIQIDAAKRIGSDCVLLIKSVFDQDLAEGSMEKFVEYAYKKALQVIIEVHTEDEFKEVLNFNKTYRDNLIGINNRNLNDLKIDIHTTERLLQSRDKAKTIVISESGISTKEEIQFLKKAGADAFLIGTSIMESNDIASKVRRFYLSI